ncbi:hypothetical protein LSH36_103g02023 [Paralvinella palmiformis]|uniref:Uncharacterized protein n=1 Tax=Paralvinella palmiformis TaxID=53620 RepID=A0AAD9K0H5_9ANNE|nr:hypothetical protein LSH36_103g02023 [Paralvinella palmiformis]
MADGINNDNNQISIDLDQENHNTTDSKAVCTKTELNVQDTESLQLKDLTPNPSADSIQPSVTLREKVRDLNLEFCKQTTAHGWGRVGRAQNKYVGMLWIAITIIALGFNISHVLMLVKYYLRYKYEMKTQFVSTGTEFPAITLCNVLPWSMSSAGDFLQNPNTSTYQWHELTRNMSKFDQFAELLNRSMEFSWAKDRMKQPQGYFENVGIETFLLGHSRKDFILSCTFDMQPCNISNFVHYSTPNFFNCYTFQSFDAWGRTTGPNSGLSMILYLEAYDREMPEEGAYFKNSNIGNSAGVRVTIHAPRTRPSPINQGFDIPPGYSANIGLSIHQYEHLGEPYSKCIEDVSSIISTNIDQYEYSTHDCISSCQQQYIMEHCNCVSSTLPLPNPNYDNMTYCGTWDVVTMDNLEQYLNKIHCEATNMIVFMETMITSFLDHPDRTELKAYQNLAVYNSSQLTEYDLIRANFARINIFRKSILVQQHLEKPAYEIAQLASDMGGTFGLWIGMSVISWCEVSELVMLLLATACRSLVKSKKDDSGTVQKY